MDATVEGIGGPNLLRIRGPPGCFLRGLDVHGGRQGVAVDDERQVPSGKEPGAEVQVGTERRAGVADFGQGRASFATGENRRLISAFGLQCRSRRARECLPGASARESDTSHTRPHYVPRLALHTKSGRIETDR